MTLAHEGNAAVYNHARHRAEAARLETEVAQLVLEHHQREH